MDDFVIVKDHPSLMQYVDGLQRANNGALSFYPRQTLEREAASGRLFLGLLNGEPCGYINVGAIGPIVACHQVCIQYDARRRLYGAMLVVAVEQYALDGHASGIRLRCGFDLDANEFWRSLGYNCISIVDGGIRRRRKINIWRKQLSPMLFEDVHIEPAKGVQDASLWRKHKQTGIVNQFSRGKRMKEYRNILIAEDKQSSTQDEVALDQAR